MQSFADALLIAATAEKVEMLTTSVCICAIVGLKW